jgi:hypothetical protein
MRSPSTSAMAEQRFPKIPGDGVEFVPLPERPRDRPAGKRRSR